MDQVIYQPNRPTATVILNISPDLYTCTMETESERNGGNTESEEGVFRLQQYEDSLDEILVGDVGLDVMSVMLNTECQQLDND